MSFEQAIDCFNKTVPIYICPTASGSVRSYTRLMAYSLQNWLYEKTFRPFQSDVEWGQFIAKIFTIQRPPPPPSQTHHPPGGTGPASTLESLVDCFIGLHAAICNMAEANPAIHDEAQRARYDERFRLVL
jgi:hypothetical protein